MQKSTQRFPPVFAASVQKEESMEKGGFFWEMKILKLSASSARSKKTGGRSRRNDDALREEEKKNPIGFEIEKF